MIAKKPVGEWVAVTISGAWLTSLAAFYEGSKRLDGMKGFIHVPRGDRVTRPPVSSSHALAQVHHVGEQRFKGRVVQ